MIAAYVIAKRKVNTLVLVHRKHLMEQWKERLSQFLDIPLMEIGQIGGGKKKIGGKIDVAVIQSLSRKGVVNDLVAGYGQLIVDECHHISARSFEIVARRCKSKYVLGLSATLTRRDGHHPIIYMNCGPVRHTVNQKIQAANRDFIHRVVPRNTGVSPAPEFRAGVKPIHLLYEFLIKNSSRNTLIVDDILRSLEEGKCPLVLTERKEHMEVLRGMLEPAVKNLIVLAGGMGIRQKKTEMEKLFSLPASEEKLILATGRYLGEGFDYPQLDTLFLTLPVSWKGVVAQYAGRLHRDFYGKREVVIYDYLDENIPMMRKMYERRLSGYRAIGYEIA